MARLRGAGVEDAVILRQQVHVMENQTVEIRGLHGLRISNVEIHCPVEKVEFLVFLRYHKYSNSGIEIATSTEL